MQIKQFLIAVCIGTMFAACSSREDVEQNTPIQKKINITTSIAGIQTRAISNATNLQDTQFAEGAAINVYYTNAMTEQPLDNEKPYATYTLGATGWTTEATGLYYPVNGDGVSAFGIYPATDANGTPITMSTTTFEVQEHQDTDDGYKKSDLMYVWQPACSSWEDPIDLEFNHCLTKITVKIVLDPDVISEQEFKNKLVDIAMWNLKRRGTLSFDNNKITATVDPSSYVDVYMYDNGRPENFNMEGMSCIIIPQSVQGYFDAVYVNCGSQEYYWYAPAEGFEFKPGKEYIFTFNIGNSDVSISNPTIKNWDSEPVTSGEYK